MLLSKDKYYEIMQSMKNFKTFEELHENWYNCFEYILRSFKVGFGIRSINSLYYDFQMSNWTAMHIENTEFKDYTKEMLIKKFCSECFYICDRTSYDRLFRTHWFFINAFGKEIYNIKYPEFIDA